MDNSPHPGLCRLVIIVLYRTDLPAAPTMQSMLKSAAALNADDRIIIWDNSPRAQDAATIDRISTALPCEVHYRHTPENISLAVIYNTVIREYDHCDILHLFDQDSVFDAQYFEAVNEAALLHPQVNLFLPLIRNGAQVVSPGNFHYVKGRYWSAPRYGLVPAKNNVAITSGMAIRMPYLRDFGGFDERLKLYGIDTNFMLRYARENAHFFVLDLPFGHDLSGFNEESHETRQRRFEDFARASRVNAGLFPLPVRLLTRLFLFYKRMTF